MSHNKYSAFQSKKKCYFGLNPKQQSNCQNLVQMEWSICINNLPKIVSCTSSKSLSQSELDYHRIDQSINGSDQSDEK